MKALIIVVVVAFITVQVIGEMSSVLTSRNL